MPRGVAGAVRWRRTTRRTRRCSVLGHPTAVDRGRGAASALVPRASQRLKTWQWPFPSSVRLAPRRCGCGPVESNQPAASLRSVVLACRARLTPSSLACGFASSPSTPCEGMLGGKRGRCARRCGLEKSTRGSSGAAGGVCAPGGVCATASVKAPRCVTSTTASGESSTPRAARGALPVKPCPRPHVCLPRCGMQDASCAERRSERGASAVLSTR